MKTVKFGHRALNSLMLFVFLIFMGACSETQVDEVLDDVLNSSSRSIPEGWSYSSARTIDFEPCAAGTFCLVAGQHIDAGTLDAAYDNDGNFYITYNTSNGWYLTEVHLFVGHSAEDIPTNINNHPKIGHFPYKMTFDAGDMTTSHTVMIENPHIGTENQYGCISLVIAAHAVVVNDAECEETAWARLCDDYEGDLTSQRFVEEGTWATYISGTSLCIQPCEVDFSFAWEDINVEDGNDGDYNDLVVQTIIWKEVIDDDTKTQIKFIAKARGAGYDHAFWIDLGGGDTRTIFESSKAVLTGTEGGFAHNTLNPCNPLPFAEFTITVDDDLVYTDMPPFMPMITVYPSGTYLDPTGKYDLNIWELAEAMTPGSGDTYVIGELTYPNGVFIPADWLWPLEYTTISLSYENFMDIDNWDDEWYNNLSDGTKVWDPENAVCE